MKNFNWKDLLREHALFSNLDPKEVERIIMQLLDDKVSEEREYSEGMVIVREGELGDSVFLVGRGVVQVVLEGDSGSGTPISTLRQGEFFGEMALLEKKPRAATVKAKESCVLLEIKGQEFLKLLDEHKDVESKMLLKLSERLRHANDQILAVRMRGVDEKLENLKAKFEGELKAVDASLQAAQAVFDQTKIRTDEIIISADRSRTRLNVTATAVSGVVGVILAIFGWIGFDKFQKIDEMAKQARTDAADISKTKVDTKEAADIAQSFREISRRLAQNVLFPRFEEALEKNVQSMAVDLYKDIWELKAKDPTVIGDVLNRIEVKISERPDADYIDLLGTVLEDARDPKDIIKCRYLILANAILIKGVDRGSLIPYGFDTTFSSLKEYIEKHKDKKISKGELDLLEKLFEQQDKQKQQSFNNVKKVILKL